MRKTKTILLMLICMLSLTGCVRMKVSVEITKNGKANVSMLYAVMDTSVFGEESADRDEMEEEMEEWKQDGWECTYYEDGDYYGYERKKEGISLKELGEVTADDGEASEIQIEKKGGKYYVDWDVLGEEDREDISSYGEYIEQGDGYCTFELKLPSKPIESNATSVSDDGKTLKWNLLEESHVHVVYKASNPLLPIIGIAAGIILAIILVVVIILISNKNKKKAAAQQQPYMPPVNNNQFPQG